MTDPTRPPASAHRPHRGLLRLPPAAERRPAPRTKAHTADSRVRNRALVLATLYQQGAMTRSDLVRNSGLTAPTVSALVTDLMTGGLVDDIGPREGTRLGKPANLVRIADDTAGVVALDLSHSDRFTGAVVNLRGRVMARAEVPIGDALGDEAAAFAMRLLDDLMARAPRTVVGVGVGTPGIVDDTGVIRHAAHLGWSDLPLAGRITERFGAPAHIGNDINMAALAVLRARDTRAQNLMVVAIEHGVGAGLVVGGRLVEGGQFAAGEIGHVTVGGGDGDADGDAYEDGYGAGGPCVCGRRGCLDQAISAVQLRARLDAAGPDGRAAVLAAAGRALGTVLAPIVSVLNLNEVVLTGPSDLVDGALPAAAAETVRARTLEPISASLTVRSLADDTDLVLTGAACRVLAAELGVF
ncbi:ROK family transcriptional regulator [Actinacidiphila alni]|uniref:ROK family transcriptional regulator n=1 Tax=Actinacidiphila alni TaxID=380248 RepID=UPI003453C7DD